MAPVMIAPGTDTVIFLKINIYVCKKKEHFRRKINHVSGSNIAIRLLELHCKLNNLKLSMSNLDYSKSSCISRNIQTKNVFDLASED